MPNQMEGVDPKERSKFMSMTDLKTYPDAMKPAWNNNGLSQGTSSAAFLEGDQWGPWDGRLVVGIMGIGFGGTPTGQRIDVIDLSEDCMSAEVETLAFPSAAGRFRSVVQGPDGSLYAAVDEGVIHKLTPKN
jgi:glucose/arabinose dehydrogenase